MAWQIAERGFFVCVQDGFFCQYSRYQLAPLWYLPKWGLAFWTSCNHILDNLKKHLQSYILNNNLEDDVIWWHSQSRVYSFPKLSRDCIFLRTLNTFYCSSSMGALPTNAFLVTGATMKRKNNYSFALWLQLLSFMMLMSTRLMLLTRSISNINKSTSIIFEPLEHLQQNPDPSCGYYGLLSTLKKSQTRSFNLLGDYSNSSFCEV